MTKERLVVTCQQMLVWKNICDAETNQVVVGKKSFLAAVPRGAAQTTGLVTRNGGATTTLMHMGKTTPATGDRVVAPNCGATS